MTPADLTATYLLYMALSLDSANRHLRDARYWGQPERRGDYWRAANLATVARHFQNAAIFQSAAIAFASR